jgi:integrase
VATVEQVDELADAIDGRYRALVYLATYATLRYGELFALRRRSIDLERREVTVVEEVVQLAGGETLFGPPKSDAGRRAVSLPRSIVPEIRRHLDAFVPDDPDAFVFRGEKGALPNRSNWNKMWRKVTAQVGVDELHFHDLRHTGNTLSASTWGEHQGADGPYGTRLGAGGAHLPARQQRARRGNRRRTRRNPRVKV